MSKAESRIKHWYNEALKDPNYRAAYDAINTPIERLLRDKTYEALWKRIGAPAQGGIRDPMKVFQSFYTSIAAGVFSHPHARAFIAARLRFYVQMGERDPLRRGGGKITGAVSLDDAFGL